MRRHSLPRVALLLCACSAMARTQSLENNLNLFGYFQTTFEEIPATASRHERNNFELQQLNMMIEKGFDPQFSAFINFSFTNTYSSEKNWGSFDIEDAWLRYRQSNMLNLKGGLLVPAFNNLNEIKDQTPLLPYIVRPGVYEQSVSDLLTISDFVPQQAFFQVYGFLPAGNANIDYAVYVGNSEPAYINGLGGNYVVRGADTTSFKMIGARLGLRIQNLKVGVSSTADKSNRDAIGLGAVQRYRIGADASYHVAGLFMEGELIVVMHMLSADQQSRLDQLASVNPMVSNSLSEKFSYVVVGYDCTDKAFVYAGENYVTDKSSPYIRSGFHLYTGGAGYRLNDDVVLKGQYLRYQLGDNPFSTLKEDHFLIAVSVMF